MGLTSDSTGKNVFLADETFISESCKAVALAGNPNVGKSTVFNKLTGLRQHTGNWTGKTVATAYGKIRRHDKDILLVDIPGTYSLIPHSNEEQVARDFICFGKHDAVVVVCDAGCLERNFNLVLQTAERTENTIVCVNLVDEAQRRGISVDVERLSELTGLACAGVCARSGKGLDRLVALIDDVVSSGDEQGGKVIVTYSDIIENAVQIVSETLKNNDVEVPDFRWTALKILSGEKDVVEQIKKYCGFDFEQIDKVDKAIVSAKKLLLDNGLDAQSVTDCITGAIMAKSKAIADEVVTLSDASGKKNDERIDRIVTGKYTAFPIMFVLLAFVFWLTVNGANVPSEWLSYLLFGLEEKMAVFCESIGVAEVVTDCIVHGAYRVLAWVVSVMLPPMAIFFPLFTLLEDAGFLPRVAYNLDRCFARCNACGKQALTTCMGFGCNAAGVVGCRIIDSDRERLIAMLTNNFVPCNGRFPLLICIITMFFAGTSFAGSVFSSLILALVIVLGIVMTFVCSYLLSKTVLKGKTSSFTLELPPYRRPQLLQVLVRSVLDRTLFVLGRAAVVALPAGLLIWLLGNINIGEVSVLTHISTFLDPFAAIIGLDGVLLCAFVFGFPANEIVLPIALMIYLSQGTLGEIEDVSVLRGILVANGWTVKTAVCTMLFSLMHWPCSTTLMTIHKEAGSARWTFLAFAIPTACGIIVCTVANLLMTFFGL